MRPDITAGDRTLLDSGDYDLWWEWEVANGDGTMVDVSDRVSATSLTLPNPNQPVGTATVRFNRELERTANASLAPFMEGSTLNRLDDGTTYSPLLEIGRRVIGRVAITARGASRPASGYYEVLYGRIADVDWPEWEGAAQILCRDQAGEMQKVKSETAYTYDSGIAIETAIQEVLDNNGYSAITLSVPVATGKVLSANYAPGVQKTVWSQVWALAQSIGWVIWWRYDASGNRQLTLFEPDRDKAVSDFTVAKVREVTQLRISEEEIGNVAYGVYTDENGARRTTAAVEDAVSIAKYGGIRRSYWISEAEDSPIRSDASMTALLQAALSDTADPDAIMAVRVPGNPFLECSVDLCTFSANGRHFDTDQLLAPFSVTVDHQEGRDHESTINVRGRPSGGYITWAGRREDVPQGVDEYSLIGFREVVASAAGKRRFAWDRRGAEVSEVWWAYETFAAESGAASEDKWATVKAAVLPLADDQDYVEVDAPDASKYGLLQVEPRQADMSVDSREVVYRRELYPVPANVNLSLTAQVVSDLVDLTVKVAATTSSYPVTVVVWEDAETSGAQLASFTLTADGSKTKADDADLGGRSLPATGKKTWIAVATDVAGNTYRSVAEVGSPTAPYFSGVRSAMSTSLLAVDVFGTVTDPGGLGGTLSYWLPADPETPADPSGAPTGELVIAKASMPFTFGPASIAAFDDVTVAGSSLGLFLEFIATDGRTSGAQKFTLDSSLGFLVDAFGLLRAESVHNGLVLAQEYRPYFLGTGAPTLTPDDYGTDRYFDTDALQPYSHDGSAWNTDNTTPAVSYAPILRAGVVSAEVIAAGAIAAKLVGAERLTADNINIGALDLIATDLGAAINNGLLTSADGSTYLDLNATGTDPIFYSSKFQILASGSATFSGTVASTSFTGSSATFNGDVSIGAPSATGATLSITGEVTPPVPGPSVQLTATLAVSSDNDTLTVSGVTTLAVSALSTTGTATVGGNLAHGGTNAGFFGATPGAKPTASGSRGGNAALASLLTGLSGLGLITDSTTA